MSNGIDRDRVQDFLIHEAELLDERKFEDWNQLFTSDGLYWIPLDAERDPREEWALIYDDALRREERVYHLTEVPFPSQRPESRTLHLIGNVRVGAGNAGHLEVISNQIIYEIRVGDFRQVGLGEQRSFAAKVEFELVDADGEFRIARKVVHLLNRGVPIGNLTFIL
jgi:3-phenylpropionate/cinnamic acid dioxygenase small subunit